MMEILLKMLCNQVRGNNRFVIRSKLIVFEQIFFLLVCCNSLLLLFLDHVDACLSVQAVEVVLGLASAVSHQVICIVDLYLADRVLVVVEGQL